jgi:hypothetical protein
MSLVEVFMDALAEKLDAKLREWKPETANQVRRRVAEMMQLLNNPMTERRFADHDMRFPSIFGVSAS